jgi:hypothetical protein
VGDEADISTGNAALHALLSELQGTADGVVPGDFLV